MLPGQRVAWLFSFTEKVELFGSRFVRHKFERNRINAVARIFWGKSFARKNMAKVGTASDTGDFGTRAIGIGGTSYCPFDFVVETGPATTRIKLVGRAVQRRAASFADIGAFFIEFFVLAGKRPFGSFAKNYILFFRSQRAELNGIAHNF